jgi:uncharacterized protein (DUF58 family)
MKNYWLFLVLLLVVAAILRGDFAISVLYFFIGSILIGKWWSGKAFNNLISQRNFDSHTFLGDIVPVKLEVRNQGWLPILWLRLYESLPAELAVPNAVNQVISLGTHGRSTLTYSLLARKRGYYPIGPLFTTTGDLLGLSSEQHDKGEIDYLTVYPRIIRFTHLKLPSRSPQGLLKSTQPVFEDPTRVTGKRDYVAGDSLRRVDWKASATVGRLLVKQFEPSISIETEIFLDLNLSDYETHFRIDSTELAIVIAASLASWVVEKKQAVGLATNGVNPLEGTHYPGMLLPRKGRSHLTHILGTLARLQAVETHSITTLLQQKSLHLTWGTTMIVITGKIDDDLFDELYKGRKRGLNAVIILAGRNTDWQETQRKAELFGFPAVAFQTEQDLDLWRQ